MKVGPYKDRERHFLKDGWSQKKTELLGNRDRSFAQLWTSLDPTIGTIIWYVLELRN